MPGSTTAQRTQRSDEGKECIRVLGFFGKPAGEDGGRSGKLVVMSEA